MLYVSRGSAEGFAYGNLTWSHGHPSKIEIDNQMGILCELLMGKWIHNTLSSLAKFHLCAGAQPGGLGKHFPEQQWHDASRSTAGMSLAGRGANFKRCATMSCRIIDPFTLPGVDPAGWFSTVHSSALNLLLTQSNQHQTDSIKFPAPTCSLHRVASLRGLLPSSLSLKPCLLSEHLHNGALAWGMLGFASSSAVKLPCDLRQVTVSPYISSSSNGASETPLL